MKHIPIDDTDHPVALRCEYLTDPLGVDVLQPGLSWRIASDRRGVRQTAYRILVALTLGELARDQGDVWDSGRVESSQTVQIPYAGRLLASGQRYFWKVQVWTSSLAGASSAWSQPATWTMGLLHPSDWQGPWIGARPGKPSGERFPFRDGRRDQPGPIDPADAPAVLLRRQITLDRRPVRAVAHICGLGYHEWYIDGRRVGDRQLDQAYTDYTRRVCYTTHDITELMTAGDHAIGVMLGNGLYCLQTPDLFQLEKAPWRTPPRLRLQITLEYADGSTSSIVADRHWRISTGPIIYNCIRGGETIDARIDPGAWLEPGFDDQAWPPALEVDAPLGTLTAQLIPPIRITDQYPPQAIREPVPGVQVVDFGGNLAGWVRLRTAGPAGQRVTLIHGEQLKPDGTLDTSANASHTYGRYQHQECILSGRAEDIFEPRFTYHAFRYVEIRGLARPLQPDDLVAMRLHADLARAGSFTCSDQRFDLLHDAARRTLEDCTWSGPTSEPVREKVKWTGDDHLLLDAYFSLLDCTSIYRKQIQDIIDAQEANGHFSSVVPSGGWDETAPADWPDDLSDRVKDYEVLLDGKIVKFHCCDGPAWSLSLPYDMLRLAVDYEDRRLLEPAYAACCRHLDFLTRTAVDGIISWGLWDWLQRNGSIETKSEFISTVAYYRHASLTADLARLLQRSDEAAACTRLAESIREAFNRRFYDAAGGCYRPGSQTAQSLPLVFGLVPPAERERVQGSLLARIRAAGGKLETGFVGTLPTFVVLEEMGHTDLVQAMVEDGWFHMLGLGARSTLGESPYTPFGGYGSGHHQFGAMPAGWIYRCLAGIRPDPLVGYRDITLRPSIGSRLTWVKAHHDCIHGRIACAWSVEGSQLTLEVAIPANTTATIHVPSMDPATVRESGLPLAQAVGLRFLRQEAGRTLITAASGCYRLTAQLPEHAMRRSDEIQGVKS